MLCLCCAVLCRVLRIFKLARGWPRLLRFLTSLGRSIAGVNWMFVILLLVVYILAVMGMQLFGYEFQFCDHVDGAQPVCPPGEDCPSHRDCYVPCSADQVGSC